MIPTDEQLQTQDGIDRWRSNMASIGLSQLDIVAISQAAYNCQMTVQQAGAAFLQLATHEALAKEATPKIVRKMEAFRDYLSIPGNGRVSWRSWLRNVRAFTG